MYVWVEPDTGFMLSVRDVSVTVKVVPGAPCWTQSSVKETLYLQSSSLFIVPTLGSGSGSGAPASISPPSSGPVMHMPTALNMPMPVSGAIPGTAPPSDMHCAGGGLPSDWEQPAAAARAKAIARPT